MKTRREVAPEQTETVNDLIEGMGRLRALAEARGLDADHANAAAASAIRAFREVAVPGARLSMSQLAELHGRTLVTCVADELCKQHRHLLTQTASKYGLDPDQAGKAANEALRVWRRCLERRGLLNRAVAYIPQLYAKVLPGLVKKKLRRDCGRPVRASPADSVAETKQREHSRTRATPLGDLNESLDDPCFRILAGNTVRLTPSCGCRTLYALGSSATGASGRQNDWVGMSLRPGMILAAQVS